MAEACVTAFATEIGRLISHLLMYTHTIVKHASQQETKIICNYSRNGLGRMLELDIHVLSARSKTFNIRLILHIHFERSRNLLEYRVYIHTIASYIVVCGIWHNTKEIKILHLSKTGILASC